MQTLINACGNAALWLAIAALAATSPAPARADDATVAWPAGPFEVRVARMTPWEAKDLVGLAGQSIEADFSRLDRTAKANPSPMVSSDLRGTLRIAADRLADAGRTLILITDPHPRAGVYSAQLALPEGRSLAIAYDLNGVEAAWESEAGEPAARWTAWWPSLDPETSRRALQNSIEHVKQFKDVSKPGRLTLTAMLDAPRGANALRIRADAPVEASLNGEGPAGDDAEIRGEKGEADFAIEFTGEPALLIVSVPTGKKPSSMPTLELRRQAADGQTSSGPRLILPWAPMAAPVAAAAENVPNLEGGDAGRGAVVFASMEAKCANCHKIRGQGGEVGPDLSNLATKAPAEIYQDIFNPSARIHPDYVTYTLALKDGRVLVGTVRAEGADSLKVTDTEAKQTVVPREQVEDLRPSAASIMPVGLTGAIGEDKLRDLMAYLTQKPPGG